MIETKIDNINSIDAAVPEAYEITIQKKEK